MTGKGMMQTRALCQPFSQQTGPYLGPFVNDYESHVAQNGLPDIAFHMKDLLHGHGDYEGIDQSVRKKLLIHFNIFMQKAPVRYRTFVYGSYDTDAKNLSAKMRRDIVTLSTTISSGSSRLIGCQYTTTRDRLP